MRRVFLLVAGSGLLGAALGCNTTHGICDCDIPAPGPHPPVVCCPDGGSPAHVDLHTDDVHTDLMPGEPAGTYHSAPPPGGTPVKGGTPGEVIKPPKDK